MNVTELESHVSVSMVLIEIFEFSGIILSDGVDVGFVDDILRDILQVLGVVEDLLESIIFTVCILNFFYLTFIIYLVYIFYMFCQIMERTIDDEEIFRNASLGLFGFKLF